MLELLDDLVFGLNRDVLLAKLLALRLELRLFRLKFSMCGFPRQPMLLLLLGKQLKQLVFRK